MFDLNRAIRAWSDKMRGAGNFRPDAVSPMESHLRRAVSDLSASGLSEEESFWVAARRVGGIGEVAREFGRNDPGIVWRQRLFWMAAGCLAYLLVSGFWGVILSGGLFIALANDFSLMRVWSFQLATTALLLAGSVVLVRYLVRQGTFGVDAFFARMTRRQPGRVLVVVAAAFLLAGIRALQACAPVLMVRAYTAGGLASRDMSMVYTQSAIFGWIMSIAIPVLLLLLMLWAHPSRGSVPAQR